MIGKTSTVETEAPGITAIPPTVGNLLCGSGDPAMDRTEEARNKIKEDIAEEGIKRDKSKVATVRVPHSAAVQISDEVKIAVSAFWCRLWSIGLAILRLRSSRHGLDETIL